MEPIFTAAASETVTAELAAQIADTIAALPPAHRLTPTEREPVESKEAAFVRLQDWAFIKGFALVKESAKTKNGQVIRVYFDCVHHKKDTKNSRKLAEEERKRVQTKTQANNCKFSIYVSYQKRLGGWVLNSKNLEHNHAPNPDPFQCHQHQDKKPGYAEAIMKAASHRGLISYKKSAAILQRDGLEIGQKQYYNLHRKEGQGTLTRQEELQLILQTLEQEGIHPRCREEYIVDSDGERTGRVVKDLFWMSSEQIRMARRFVNGFMYEIDATFNTNCLRLPLSVMVGIDNTGKTFPIAYCYITSESAASFTWISEQLTDLVFYDCPEAAIIVGDFSTGLGAAVTAKAAVDLGLTEVVDEALVCPPERDQELPEAPEVIVGKTQYIRLQLCEWHAVAAIKRRLISAGKYKKERREELILIIWNWVQATSNEDLDKRRKELLAALHSEEAEYITNYYQPKEHQFCRAYTCTYLNLGVHSTQRSESYHVVVKDRLHKHLPVSKAIQIIVEQTRYLGRLYDAEINRQRRNTPRLLDKAAFGIVKDKLTHYALELSMKEWSATKQMADAIEREEFEFEFDPDKGCSFGCELPVRYCLPYKHWMYASVIQQSQLPLSLFHPRWYFDGPAVLYNRWVMTWDPENPEVTGSTLADRHAGDRYAARGQQMVEESALAILNKLKTLPPGVAESFALSFAKGTEGLLAAQDKKMLSRQLIPAALPEPLVETTNLRYKKGKKRAMTGLEVAEERERDASRQRRYTEQEEAKRIETKLVADTQLGFSQAVPLAISSDGDSDEEASDNEPRRSGRVKTKSKILESQQWQIDNGLISKPGAKAKARVSNAKKARQINTSQLLDEFEFLE